MFFLKLLGVLILVSWIIFLLVISLLLGKKIQDIKKKREEQEAELEEKFKKEERQKEEEKRRDEESLKLKPKYQSNSNLNKMFDDCVNDIISCCKKAQNSIIAKKGSEAFIYFDINVNKNAISVSADEEWSFDFIGSYLHFVDYGIIPLKGDNVDAKILAIKELLSERLCSEIAKIDSNFKAKPNGSYVYVTITNEPQGVEL